MKDPSSTAFFRKGEAMITELQQYLADEFEIHFKNTDLLAEAFTQASYVNEHPDQNLKFYERIEFLGDAVLQLFVSEYIYKRYPELPQGKLTRLRAAMVCEDSFSKFAKECHFDQYIRLGKGEEMAGARQRSGLLCDIFESFIGALYLDQGRDAVEKFIHRVIFQNWIWDGLTMLLMLRHRCRSFCSVTVTLILNTISWLNLGLKMHLFSKLTSVLMGKFLLKGPVLPKSMPKWMQLPRHSRNYVKLRNKLVNI